MRRTQSYTSIKLYKKCPRQWEWRYVHGHKEPDGPYAARGNVLHDKLEQFFLGKTPYPTGDKALAPWQRFMENLTKFNPSPEAKFAVDDEWHECDYDNKEARAKGKADLVYIFEDRRHIFDWKSGRVYPDHEAQGLMYIALDPVESLHYTTNFVYLDMPTHTIPRNYENIHKRVEIGKLNAIIDTMNADTVYEPTPSPDSCQYCPLNWRKGGNCRRAP